MKKLLALLTFLIGGSLSLFVLSVMGCAKAKHTFLYKDFHSSVIRYDPNGLEVSLKKNDTALYPNFLIEDVPDIMKITLNRPALTGNSAWAFQPGPQEYKPAEKISSIKIITLNPYNSNYPAGADITQACRFIVTRSFNNNNDSLLASAIENLNAGYSDNGSEVPPSLRIFLREQPASLAPQQFAVELKTEVNAYIRDTTISFYLKP